MVRVVLFLLLLAALAFGAAWIADQPGTVSVLWLGRQIEFEVLTGIVGLLVAAAGRHGSRCHRGAGSRR